MRAHEEGLESASYERRISGSKFSNHEGVPCVRTSDDAVLLRKKMRA